MKKNVASSEKIHEALDSLKGVSEEKRLELKDLVSELYEKVQNAEEMVVDKAQEAAGKVNNAVHENPWVYLLGATVVAFISGLFIRSRQR